MRTATTLVKTKGGWKLAAGPDVSADKQRKDFNGIGSAWPNDIEEVRFQPSDGPAKIRSRQKAESIAAYSANASKQADFKARHAADFEAEKQAAIEKADAEAKAKEQATINEANKAKEAAKAQTTKPKEK